jgi:hypothetical protein
MVHTGPPQHGPARQHSPPHLQPQQQLPHQQHEQPQFGRHRQFDQQHYTAPQQYQSQQYNQQYQQQQYQQQQGPLAHHHHSQHAQQQYAQEQYNGPHASRDSLTKVKTSMLKTMDMDKSLIFSNDGKAPCYREWRAQTRKYVQLHLEGSDPNHPADETLTAIIHQLVLSKLAGSPRTYLLNLFTNAASNHLQAAQVRTLDGVLTAMDGMYADHVRQEEARGQLLRFTFNEEEPMQQKVIDLFVLFGEAGITHDHEMMPYLQQALERHPKALQQLRTQQHQAKHATDNFGAPPPTVLQHATQLGLIFRGTPKPQPQPARFLSAGAEPSADPRVRERPNHLLAAWEPRGRPPERDRSPSRERSPGRDRRSRSPGGRLVDPRRWDCWPDGEAGNVSLDVIQQRKQAELCLLCGKPGHMVGDCSLAKKVPPKAPRPPAPSGQA